MQFTTILSLGALATSAAALPQSGQGPKLKPWNVTNMVWDFPQGSSTQDIFDVSGRADYGMPAFSAKCFASNYDKTYRACSGDIPHGAKVSNYWTQGDGNFANVYIKYHANGKTLIGERSVTMSTNSYNYQFYPAVKRTVARDAENDDEFQDEESE